MRLLPALLVLVLMLAGTALGDDFRGLDWGASTAQIQAAETWELAEQRNDGLLYRGQVAGLNALAYYFVIPATDQLAAARYVFVDTYGEGYVKNPYTDDQYTADDFRNLSSLLKQKYGSPTKVSASSSASWETSTTQVLLQRHEDKDNFFNTIDYRSVTLGDAWDAWVRSQNPL